MDPGFNVYLSYIIVAIIWIAMAILAVILYVLFPPEIYYWNKVYDGCTKNEAKYQYIIRLIFKDVKKNFDMKTTTITLEIVCGENVEVTTKITPKFLSESFVRPSDNFKVCRFLLYRRQPIRGITNVLLNHDGVGSIRVVNVEIQEIGSPKANIAFVGADIQRLTTEKAENTQLSPAATQETREIEPELRPSHTLSGLEYLLFFFVAFNLILLTTIYVVPCQKESVTFCSDYSKGLLSSLYSGIVASVVAAIVFVVICVVYRYLIKNSAARGKKGCEMVKCIYLTALLIAGTAMGIAAALMAATNNYFPKDNPHRDGDSYHHEIYWMFAVGIALVLFFMLWISVVAVIAYLIGFFTEPIEPLQNETKGSPEMNSKIDDSPSSDDHYTKIVTNPDFKVNSISQYKNKGSNTRSAFGSNLPSSASGVKSDVKSEVKAAQSAKSQSIQRTDDEDTGEKYYETLMKTQGKVKSVSQY